MLWLRFGYKKCKKFNVSLPFDVSDEFCMAIELKEGGLNSVVSGVVECDPAFGL